MGLEPLGGVIVEEQTQEERRAMVVDAVRETLGISLEEFRTQVDRGLYDGVDEDPIIRLLMMLPAAS